MTSVRHAAFVGVPQVQLFVGFQNDQPLVTPPPRPRLLAWRYASVASTGDTSLAAINLESSDALRKGSSDLFMKHIARREIYRMIGGQCWPLNKRTGPRTV